MKENNNDCFVFLNTDDMIETENESLRERVTDLEKKILEQNDEIVCLRSTLADVLRRLAQLEGSRTLSTPPAKNGFSRGNILAFIHFLSLVYIVLEKRIRIPGCLTGFSDIFPVRYFEHRNPE